MSVAGTVLHDGDVPVLWTSGGQTHFDGGKTTLAWGRPVTDARAGERVVIHGSGRVAVPATSSARLIP